MMTPLGGWNKPHPGGFGATFAGPIEDNEGKLRVPSGGELSSEDAATKMNWLVAPNYRLTGRRVS